MHTDRTLFDEDTSITISKSSSKNTPLALDNNYNATPQQLQHQQHLSLQSAVEKATAANAAIAQANNNNISLEQLQFDQHKRQSSSEKKTNELLNDTMDSNNNNNHNKKRLNLGKRKKKSKLSLYRYLSHNKQAYELFKQFLVGSLAIENLLFLVDVQTFRLQLSMILHSQQSSNNSNSNAQLLKSQQSQNSNSHINTNTNTNTSKQHFFTKTNEKKQQQENLQLTQMNASTTQTNTSTNITTSTNSGSNASNLDAENAANSIGVIATSIAMSNSSDEQSKANENGAVSSAAAAKLARQRSRSQVASVSATPDADYKELGLVMDATNQVKGGNKNGNNMYKEVLNDAWRRMSTVSDSGITYNISGNGGGNASKYGNFNHTLRDKVLKLDFHYLQNFQKNLFLTNALKDEITNGIQNGFASEWLKIYNKYVKPSAQYEVKNFVWLFVFFFC